MQYFHVLLLSLFLHIAIVSLLDKVPDDRKEKVPIEVVYPENRFDRSIVRETEDRDVKETEEERKARFLSEREKRFKEESRVRDSGLSQNAGGGSPKKEQPKKEGDGPGPKKLAKQFQPETTNELMPPGPGVGPRAAIGEKLPSDVKFGNFNALNSDRFLYYSFFARIEERIRPRWEMSVKSVMQETNPVLFRRREWLTNIEIVLDKTGKFQRAILHKKSGIDELDIAAVDAFRNGAPFQNPPQEMVQEDGRIHLHYSISVSAN
jgi:hypothetical protein